MPGHQLRPERADKSGGRTFLGPPSFRDSAGPRDVAQEAGRVLTLTGLHRRLEIFPTVQAAATGAQAARHGTRGAAARGRAARACPGPAHRPAGPSPAPAGADDLRGAVAALLACADAGMMPIPAAGSPRPWPRWPAPAMAPMTPPWSGRHDPCCLPSPAIPSPHTRGRRNRHPAAAGPPSRVSARPGLRGEGPHNEQKRHGTAPVDGFGQADCGQCKGLLTGPIRAPDIDCYQRKRHVHRGQRDRFHHSDCLGHPVPAEEGLIPVPARLGRVIKAGGCDVVDQGQRGGSGSSRH